MKKTVFAALLSLFVSFEAFADEAMPEIERPTLPAPSAHPLADSVLPYVGVAVGLAIIAVVLIVVINNKKKKK